MDPVKASSPDPAGYLDAVFLEETGWLRVDARGNPPGIYPEPLPVVVAALAHSRSFEDVLRDPPDWDGS